VPLIVVHWHVSKLKSHVESPLEHCQLLFIKVLPFSVLKLTALAGMVACVNGSTIEQLSKNHWVSDD